MNYSQQEILHIPTNGCDRTPISDDQAFDLEVLQRKTKNPNVIWEEPRRHTSRQSITTQRSPRWLQWDAPHLPSKWPLLLQRSPPPCNTPIPRPTPLTTPNGIQIQSAVLPQYTLRTDRPTDMWARREVCTKTVYALYIDSSDAAKNARLIAVSIHHVFVEKPRLTIPQDRHFLRDDSVQAT